MRSRQPAALPPIGLAGLDPEFSRLVTVPGDGTWHVLDNGRRLAELGRPAQGTLLCVHGNPTWSYLWRHLITAATAAAAAGGAAWRVVAPDQLEMGFSERTGRARNLPQRVADLGRLTDALGLEGPVVTVGHDWGGVIVLGWAVDHPGRLAGIASLNTAVHQPVGAPVPPALRLVLQPALLAPATAATPAFLETTLALALPPLPAEVKAAFRAPYRTADRRTGIRDFVADIPAAASHPSRPELDRIAEGVRGLDVPSLLLWGARDPVFSDRYLDDLANRLTAPRIHRFPEAGHLVSEDVDIARPLLAWLDEDVAPQRPASGVLPSSDARDAARKPLWAVLDRLRDSGDPALVELAPPGGTGPRTISWRLLARRVEELAAGLTRAGVRPGDRVSLLVRPGADLTAALYACLRIGAVAVIADAGLGLRGLSRAVTGARPDWILGALPGLAVARLLRWPGRRISVRRHPALLTRLLGTAGSFPELARLGEDRQLPRAPAPSATAAVLFTSGSTGPAKGVVYTHGQLRALCDALAEHYDIGVGTGLVAGFAPFALLGPALGARSASPDMDVTSPATLTAVAVAEAVAAVDASVVFLSPAAVANVVATAEALAPSQRAALARVRTVLSAGAPVARELLEGIAALMPNAMPSTPYGATEGLLLTSAGLELLRGDDGTGRNGVCVGLPVAGVRVRIAALDDTGAATGAPSSEPDVTGEIVVSAAHLRSGYDRLWLTEHDAGWRDSEGVRWHRMGDVGHLDAEGRLWVEGRLVHVLVTADGVVTPVGPEQRIGALPEVARAGLAGVGPRGTQQPVAVVETVPPVRRPGLAPPDLAAKVRGVAGVPLAAVLVVPRLPTDIRHNSKVDRTRLSRWAERVLAGGRMGSP